MHTTCAIWALYKSWPQGTQGLVRNSPKFGDFLAYVESQQDLVSELEDSGAEGGNRIITLILCGEGMPRGSQAVSQLSVAFSDRGYRIQLDK